MVLLVTQSNLHQHCDLLEDAYRFRHRHFVERLGWEGLRKPDGREIDQFDGPDCVHLIEAENGKVIIYVRLLPTVLPHLQSHVYPEILQGGSAPTGPSVYEWTRGSVDPAKREGLRGADPATGRFYVSVAEACAHLGLDGLLVQTHPLIMGRIMELGWDVRPLALPTSYDGHDLIPIYARLTPDTVARSRALFGITGKVLHIDDERAAPAPASERAGV